jgi:hypothetical protein
MDNMDELTVLEIAEIKKMNFVTVKARIRVLGIKPARKVGRTNIYNRTILNLIDETNPVGRPPKAKPEPAKKARK